MPFDYEVTLKTNVITLPDEMLKETNLKDGDTIEISLLSPNRFSLTRAAAHSGLFKPGTQVTRQGVETYLAAHGFHPSTENADIWEVAVKRTTKQGKALGKVYSASVNVPDLVAEPQKLVVFVRLHP